MTRAEAWLRRLGRVAAGPSLIRLAVVAGAFAALMLAAPITTTMVASSAGLGLAVVAAALATVVGLWPRGRWVTAVALLAAGEWLVSTLGFDEPIGLIRVGALAAALYVMHASAALAAVVPYDAVVAPVVLLRWALRVGGVLAATLSVGLSGLALFSLLPTARSVVGPIVGSAVAAGLVGLLVWHLRRT